MTWKLIALLFAFVSLTALACTKGSPDGENAAGEKVHGEKASTAKKASAEKGVEEQAPAKYSVKLVTTKGDVVVDVTRAWAPRGADRFHQLVRSGYYSNVAFFRVIDGFMAQVGIHGDPAVNKEWRSKKIKDDPGQESNTRGMVTFATSGKHSRTTQFFVNFGDNAKLDSMGFSPFGKVRDMGVMDQIYSGYGEGSPKGNGPPQRRLHTEGSAFLKTEFPKIDYIKKATVL